MSILYQIDFEPSGEHDQRVNPAGAAIIGVLYREHEIILNLLEDLEGVGHALDRREIQGVWNRELNRLPTLVDALMNIESHYRREEEVVFAELTRMKVRCSPKVLATEHELFRNEVAELQELVHAPTTDMDRLRQKAVSSINVIVPAWWQHIFKENNILFPSFLDYVTDKHRLTELKSLSDNIGYAGFENVVSRASVVR